MTNDLLFELGSEELPSGLVQLLATALADNLTIQFKKAQLVHGNICTFATPRRIGVLVSDLQSKQANGQSSRKGPSATLSLDNPAVVGFAKSCGVSVAQLTTMTTDKGQWWVHEANLVGQNTVDLMPSILVDAIANLPIAKPMRWGNGDISFARPVHWAVLLYGDAVISTTVLGIKTGRDSFGHRYHYPQAISIPNPRQYEQLLKQAHVLVDFNARRQVIIEQARKLAQTVDCEAILPDALVDEVTSIVEWPQVLLAQFDKEFLQVPAQALIAAMQQHQKCFALRDGNMQLVPKFIAVANIDSIYPEQVVRGNEKVMHARLSDAQFFFNQDKQKTLSSYHSATQHVIFQRQLGSLADKAQRVASFMHYLEPILELDAIQAQRAAYLSQCDLMTGMVGEFPELQGLMGYYYARLDGEAEAVAVSLNEQYMPRFSADEMPASVLGQALSLACRMDTLVGAFALGQKPIGVKDPFKLRRHALAVVRLLLQLPKTLSLDALIDTAKANFSDELIAVDAGCSQLKSFILERMQSFYQGQDVSVDVVRAIRACQDDCLFDFNQRIQTVLLFIKLPQAHVLSAACKRVNNLLQKSSVDDPTILSSLLQETAEIALVEQMQRIELELESLYTLKDYAAILTKLTGLCAPVDAFFEQVMVMADDMALQKNRLCILKRLQSLLQGVADISLLHVPT